MFAGSIQGKLPEYDLVFPTEQVKLVSLAHELSWSTWKCLSVCLACDLFFVYRPAMARCQYPEIFSCTFYCFYHIMDQDCAISSTTESPQGDARTVAERSGRYVTAQPAARGRPTARGFARFLGPPRPLPVQESEVTGNSPAYDMFQVPAMFFFAPTS